MELDLANFVLQNSFAIAVTAYLLYERSKFNEKLTENLVRIAEAVERIEKAHDQGK